MAERDDLVRELQDLAAKGAALAAEHNEVVQEFLRVQERIAQLEREQLRKSE